MIHVYAHGLVNLSCCVPSEMGKQEIEKEVNTLFPTGISSPWKVSKDKTFRDGQPMPCPCENEPQRKHWLMTC